jgi:hypothetical protein
MNGVLFSRCLTWRGTIAIVISMKIDPNRLIQTAQTSLIVNEVNNLSVDMGIRVLSWFFPFLR